MLRSFSKALQDSETTLQASVVNTASNFIFTVMTVFATYNQAFILVPKKKNKKIFFQLWSCDFLSIFVPKIPLIRWILYVENLEFLNFRAKNTLKSLKLVSWKSQKFEFSCQKSVNSYWILVSIKLSNFWIFAPKIIKKLQKLVSLKSRMFEFSRQKCIYNFEF